MISLGDPEIEQQIAVFGANIRAARLRARITQSGLSNAAEVHRTAVSLLEKGLRSPDLHTLMRISHALGLHPADLLSEIGPSTKLTGAPEESGRDPRERCFSENLRRARRHAALSQRTLSERSSVDVMAISMYEGGRRNPNLRTILKLAHGLRVSPRELLLGISADAPSQRTEV